MSASETATHLNYLDAAAHLLAFTAPETSSYFMTQRNGLMLANDLEQSTAQSEHACGACGRILIPGQNSTLTLENERELARKQLKRDASAMSKTKAFALKRVAKAGPSKVFTCGNCGRYTKIEFPAPPHISGKKKPAIAVVAKTIETAKQQPPSANASSKKRAKNRKAGLQALLSQSQAGSSGTKSGLGLSLSDFMKR